MHRKLLLLGTLVFLLVAAFASAQEITPTDQTDIDPDANITWPPPVYTLRGDIEIRGSANVPGLTNYFIEFRPLETEDAEMTQTGEGTDATPEATDDDDEVERPWFPVTLPSNETVSDDVLGTWNTETTNDGLYEIRLTINVSGEAPAYFEVRPLRVENNPPDFVMVPDEEDEEEAEIVPTQPARPTLAASPTPFDDTPTATAITNANVREGDSTDYPPVSSLRAGESARILGISSSGTGWYYIDVDGERGFISPSVVEVSGDIDDLSFINPPPPPFTPTPTPTNTPIATGNLAGSPPSLTPAQPVCNQQFEVLVNITNAGNTATANGATVLIQDIYTGNGQVQSSFTRTIPVLQPGENFVVGGPLTIGTFFNEEHRIVVTIDSTNAVAETNENDNVLTTTYTLAQGSCS